MTTTPSIALSSAARQLVSSSGRVKTMFNISATGAAFLPELNSQARITLGTFDLTTTAGWQCRVALRRCSANRVASNWAHPERSNTISVATVSAYAIKASFFV